MAAAALLGELPDDFMSAPSYVPEISAQGVDHLLTPYSPALAGMTPPEKYEAALLNIAHTGEGHRPRTGDGQPAFRIMGVFRKQRGARRFSDRHYKGKSAETVYTVPFGWQTPTALCYTAERQANDAYCRERANTIKLQFQEHFSKRQEFSRKRYNAAVTQKDVAAAHAIGQEARDFATSTPEARRAAELYDDPADEAIDAGVGDTTTEVDLPEVTAEGEDEEEAEAAEATASAPPVMQTKIKRVQNQGWATVTCLFGQDTDELECAVYLHGVYQTESEALKHANDHVGKRFSSVNIEVVPMYQWVFPLAFRSVHARRRALKTYSNPSAATAYGRLDRAIAENYEKRVQGSREIELRMQEIKKAMAEGRPLPEGVIEVNPPAAEAEGGAAAAAPPDEVAEGAAALAPPMVAVEGATAVAPPDEAVELEPEKEREEEEDGVHAGLFDDTV